MSRIGKKEIAIPSGVEVKISDDMVNVKGPKGALSTPTHPKISYEMEGNTMRVGRVDDTGIAHGGILRRSRRCP